MLIESITLESVVVPKSPVNHNLDVQPMLHIPRSLVVFRSSTNACDRLLNEVTFSKLMDRYWAKFALTFMLPGSVLGTSPS